MSDHAAAGPVGRAKKRQLWREESIVEIPLGDGSFSYAYLLEFPLIVFLDGLHRERPPVEEILDKRPAFTIWVMKYAITKRHWTIIGHGELRSTHDRNPVFFNFDDLSGRVSRYFPGGAEIPATFDEVAGLECAAAWDPDHVEDRLRDHFAGRPNQWVEQLSLPRIRERYAMRKAAKAKT